MWTGIFSVSVLFLVVLFKFSESSHHSFDGYIPVLPDFRSLCSIDNAVDAKSYITLTQCLDWCEKTPLCVMMQYNHYSKLCVLKNAGIPTPAPDGRCISMEISANSSSNSSITTGPCSTRPCNDTNVCVENDNSEESYTCEPTYCLDPPTIQDTQQLSNVLRKIGESYVYKCNTQYSGFDGSPNINCTGNGTWTNTSFRCYPDCPRPPALDTAYATFLPRAPYVTNSTVYYACKPGFYNITPANVTCDEYGKWTFFECLPHCKYSEVPKVTNGEILTDANYTINKPATIVCNSDYYLFPDQPNITCMRNGSWTSPKSSCYEYCTHPDTPNNGYIHVTSPTTETRMKNGTKFKYTCNDGYYHHPSGTPEELVCDVNGNWNFPTTCYRHCGDPPKVTWDDDGQILKYIQPGPPFTVDSEAKYECIPTTHLDGPMTDTLRCNSGGNWDGLVVCCFATFDYNFDSGKCEWVNPLGK